MTTKKIIAIIKKTVVDLPTAIGGLFMSLIFFGSIFVILRTIYQVTWIPILILLGSPFMAYAARKGLSAIPYIILLLTVFCSVCIVASKGRHESLVKSVFLNGERKHHQVFVAETQDDEGNVSPEHYVTEYYFEPSQNSSKTFSTIISFATLIIPIVLVIWVYWILRKQIG